MHPQVKSLGPSEAGRRGARVTNAILDYVWVGCWYTLTRRRGWAPATARELKKLGLVAYSEHVRVPREP